MRLSYHILIFSFLSVFIACTEEEPLLSYQSAVIADEPYLNFHDSAYYVGMNTCLECHFLINESYMRTGMGRSFGRATPSKSDAVIAPDSIIYDSYKNLYYQPFWRDSTMYVREFRLENEDTIHQRLERVTYVIGSGNHTNSHIFSINGYLHQIPFTYYTQSQRFDLPPGFEDGNNNRFNRQLGLECISCHNGLPALVSGSENKYDHVPEGIDCERCHGPASIHVELKRKNILVDTSQFIDYSIVNPKRLSKRLQNDVCARCHLQGTMVLKPGKNFYDYLPGKALTNIMDIFMPVFEGGVDDLIMASHMERMTDSRCYTQSGGDMSCIDCHNPHFPVQETDVTRYNNSCANCHTTEKRMVCSLPYKERQEHAHNCVSCHMLKRDSRDIPHVIITDHKIINPKKDPKGKKVLKGLKAINNPETDPLTKAMGYLREYETFEPYPLYLDSAARFLRPTHRKTEEAIFKARVQYFFLNEQYSSIIKLVKNNGKELILNDWLKGVPFDNTDAWTAYRIGQAYENKKQIQESLIYYSKAIDLAPYQLDFQNKYGTLLVSLDRIEEAKRVFARIINEYPRNDMAWVNLGYCELALENIQQAYQSYSQALRLNPDNLQALLNLASYHAATDMPHLSVTYLKRALQIQPNHKQAKQLLDQLSKEGY